MTRARRADASRAARPSAPYVWIVGPDGCGKSTVAAAAADETSARHLYWRPAVLPLAGRWVGRTAPPGVNSAPHDVVANHSVKATLRLLYYTLDYVLGYWFVILPARLRGRPVVIERGWWDMVVDHRRYELPGDAFARRLAWLIRKPDVIVLLSAHPAVIRARKPELPAEEIERQLQAWRDVSWKRTSVVVVDAQRPVDSVVREVVDLMCPEVAR